MKLVNMAAFNILYFRVAFFAFLTGVATGICNDLDLGMESLSIKDGQITSSTADSGRPAKNGRLRFDAEDSWCATTDDNTPHLQVDLETLHIVCAVSTQGNSKADEWVKTYQLQSSTDNTSWTDYQEGGHVKNFIGNVDRTTEVKKMLSEVFLTRYVRFLPTDHQSKVCMRVELFGVKKQPENLALGKQTAQSSRSGPNVPGRAVDGNPDTNMNHGHCSHTNEDDPSWWRVDLGSDYVPVSEVHIVNRLVTCCPDRNKDYKITVGSLSTVASNPQCVGLYSFVDFIASASCFKNPLMTGRYVGILTTRQQFLQLCEVEIYTRENLAFNQPTSQSSTCCGGDAENAVNGITETDYQISPCTHTAGVSGTANPWWMVDLEREEPVSELYIVNRNTVSGDRLNGFEIRVGNDDSNGGTSNPKCGGNYSVPRGKGSSFYCRPSLWGRYVTITIPGTGKTLNLCEVEVYSERRACQMQSLGLTSNHAFSDDRFSASSSGTGNEPFKGRLNGLGFWSPSSNSNDSDYLEINLGCDFFICAVATQGNPNADEWATKFMFLFFLNNTIWNIYQENNTDKEFNANSGRNDIVKHSLKGPVIARLVRFKPTAFHGRKVLRVEVYGVEKLAVPSQAPASFAVNPLTSTSVHASWQMPPEDCRNEEITGFKLFYKKIDSGAAQTELTINNGSTLTKDVTGLDKFTEYIFQVLAFTLAGDGPKGVENIVRTNQDVPSQAPGTFAVNPLSSTSVRASWLMPPEDSRNGIITGFKLFYKKKDSGAAEIELTISSGSTLTKDVTGLDKYTEYEFQVLAFTSVGDGPKSVEETVRTNQDAPSAPTSFNQLIISPSELHGPKVNLTWSKPTHENGVITGYTVFYSINEDQSSVHSQDIGADTLTYTADVLGGVSYQFRVRAVTIIPGPNASVIEAIPEYAPSAPTSFNQLIIPPSELHGPKVNLTWSKPTHENGAITGYTVFYSINEDQSSVYSQNTGGDTLTYTADVLGGVSYQFRVRAVTIMPGPNASVIEAIPEYAPSIGPENVSIAEVNKTAWNISWVPIPREKSYGKILMYEVEQTLLSRVQRSRRSTLDKRKINSTETYVVLNGLLLCAQYSVSVRAFTGAGPGPGSRKPLITSQPGAPRNLIAKEIEKDRVELNWDEPDLNGVGHLTYTVEYSGTKDYNKSFTDTGSKQAVMTSHCVVKGLVPGSRYKFTVFGTSVCGKGITITLPSVITNVAAPLAPVIPSLTLTTVDETSVKVYLWPVEQWNGPVSAYQVIVHEVSDDSEDLPLDYDSNIGDYKNASQNNLKYYIAAELNNDPVYKEPWNFSVGDGQERGGFVNEKLQRGKMYSMYQRAVTYDKKATFMGKVSKVARISVSQATQGNDEPSSSGSSVGVPVGVSIALFIVIALVVAVIVFMRRKHRNQKRGHQNSRPMHLVSFEEPSVSTSSSTTNLVYQNVDDIRIQKEKTVPSSEEETPVYSEPDDDSPRTIPVADFANYFKSKAENDSKKLREEFKAFPGGLQFPWSVGQKNKAKNRYGNIVTYDHSRVVLEPNAGYINASYIPTFGEASKSYIATQGPTPVTVNDFWLMIWQQNSPIIVMLTNLKEMGKNKCEKYWPDSSFTYGEITVTLNKSERFADYEIRTFIVTKDKERREVVHFHFTSWPDKGVPVHATPLLGFRRKIRSCSAATDGPFVVHCSAGVGRTGTFIAMDAMLDSAKKKKSVFIQNCVQEMRSARPYMVQTDDQYIFLHQAVMEALICGITEISVHDLRIAMNKLQAVSNGKEKTGYEREFKRLEHVTSLLGAGEQATKGHERPNIKKNRFPNIVPLDTARVILMSSTEGNDYINACFVDDYKKRNAYILTQAPLENTIDDFWQMISQYSVGTVVMLNGLQEQKEKFLQYWPHEDSLNYGNATVQFLGEDRKKKITTRRFKVLSDEPRRKEITVRHLHYTGWTNGTSCPDPQEILDLLTAIQQSQQQSKDETIVFQCSNGVGRSGTVAAIMSVIERAKTEQNVDVFQAVKLIRVKRPGAVETMEQYKFCYQTVQAYLESFSNYANFSG